MTDQHPITPPPPLSPAAQAVLDAANGRCSYGPDDVLNESRWIAAAALRAAANNFYGEIGPLPVTEFTNGINNCADALIEIASELEGAQ